jgi:hypothetical protein
MMYAKYFWGFSPEWHPIITFSLAGNRDLLHRQRKPGDIIVYVGTEGEDTLQPYRGMVIGAAEIGNKSVKSEEVVDLSSAPPNHFKNEQYKWPEAIPMLRAWYFDPPVPRNEIFPKGLRSEAQVRAVPLSPEEEAAVRALRWVEVPLPETQERLRQRNLNDAFSPGPSRPGPVPIPGRHIVTRHAAERAWTYAARFGRSDIWKIGRTTDLSVRIAELNEHVPTELLNQQWVLEFDHEWPSLRGAQDMEQRVLSHLATKRASGERVRCSESELISARASAIPEPIASDTESVRH